MSERGLSIFDLCDECLPKAIRAAVSRIPESYRFECRSCSARFEIEVERRSNPPAYPQHCPFCGVNTDLINPYEGLVGECGTELPYASEEG